MDDPTLKDILISDMAKTRIITKLEIYIIVGIWVEQNYILLLLEAKPESFSKFNGSLLRKFLLHWLQTSDLIKKL